MSHLIKFETAQTLVSNFVNHNVLGPIARKKALGGTIDRNSFRDQTPVPGKESGKMAWYCWYEKNTPYYDAFFLAFEQFDNFSDNPYPVEPEHGTLLLASEQFTYSPGQNVEKMLRNQILTPASPLNQSISKSKVIELVSNFKNNFPENGNNSSFNVEPFEFINNEDPINGNKSDWETFINQPGLVAIRYYFGLDENSKTNKIRIIYIGVDTNGRNIIPTDVNTALIINKGTP